LPTEVTLGDGSWTRAARREPNGGEAVSNLNDVLAARRMKTSTMYWRKFINDVLSDRT